MKFARMLAKTVLTIALIACMFSAAAARTPSVEVVEAGVLEIDAVDKTPSVDMGIYPLDMDPTRKSLLWNAFPQPLQNEFFEKAPAIDMGIFPLGNTAKTPSLEMAVPLDDEIVRKTPSLEMAVPLDDEIARKTPSEAVREPLNVECCGPTMHFDLKAAVSAEIVIYSVDGRRVRRISEALPSGDSSLTWDGRDDRGSRAASGVYFARVQADDGGTGKGKLVLVR